MRRPRCGQSLIELAAGLLVSIPLMLCAIDCIVVTSAQEENDAVCRNVVRSLVTLHPKQKEREQELKLRIERYAKKSLANHQAGGYIEKITLGEPSVIQDKIGFRVSLNTSAAVRLPAYVPGITSERVTLNARHHCLIIANTDKSPAVTN